MTNVQQLVKGLVVTTERRTVLDYDLVLFAGLTGEFHPLHVDEIYASQTTFKKRVAQGLLVLSLCQGLLSMTEIIRKNNKALLGFNNVKFMKPVYPGDTLQAKFEVVDVRQSKKHPENSIVTVHVVCLNQRDEEVLSYDTILFV
ncbi:MAG: MaoC family dehydratase [Thermoproteota archaeon]